MSFATNVLIEPSLTLKRRLKASPEAVYAAWTDPKNEIARSQFRAGRAR